MPKVKGHNFRPFVQPDHIRARMKRPGPTEADSRKRAIYEALQDLGDVVYVIRCPDGAIKIGYTGSLLERRRDHGVPFDQILAVLPGSYELEQELHRRFRDHRAHGREYYHPHPDLFDFINQIREQAGVPPIAT
jgi:hypothetical protein